MAIRPLFPGRIGIWKWFFAEGGKPEYPEKTPRNSRTTANNKLNPNMVSNIRQSNPSHIRGRRVLSALRHPCSHNFETLEQFFPNYIHTSNNGCGIFISIFSHQLSSSMDFSTYSCILSNSFPSSMSDGFPRLAKCITACFLRP